jgi:O-antigen/teichoic acid export membrane protein
MKLDGKQQVARNTAWNLLGNGIPLLVAFLSIPILIKELGADRFGILALVWMVIGYFSFFDLGIGRATTKFVAEHLSAGDRDAIPPIFWNSIVLLAGVGLLVGILSLAIIPKLVHQFLTIPGELQQDALNSFNVLAISLPLVLVTTGIRGILEGLHRFNLVNAIKIPTNIALVVTPLMVLPFSRDLYPIVSVLVLSRTISLLFYLYFCIRAFPPLKQYSAPTLSTSKDLISYGGWLTVTNIVGTLIAMGYIDRILISSLISIESVTYYVTPFELISKLWIFPYSLMGVLFPVFTAYMVTEKDQLPDLHRSAFIYVLLMLAPIVTTAIVFARPFLGFWLGSDFAARSTVILQLFATGVLTNALAQVPFTVIQSMGRPDLTAKRHLWELPFYMVIMWYGIKRLGILGAALTWLLWSVLDMFILFWIARKLLLNYGGSYLPQNSRIIIIVFISCLGIAYYASLWLNVVWQILLLISLLSGVTVFSWKNVMDDTDKVYLMNLLRRVA